MSSNDHWHTICSSASADDLLATHAQYWGKIATAVLPFGQPYLTLCCLKQVYIVPTNVGCSINAFAQGRGGALLLPIPDGPWSEVQHLQHAQDDG